MESYRQTDEAVSQTCILGFKVEKGFNKKKVRF